MPELARERNYQEYYERERLGMRRVSVQESPRHYKVVRPARPRYTKETNKKYQRNHFIHSLVSVILLSVIMAFVYPTVYNRVIKSFFFKSPYPAIKADYYKILNPTIDYLHNNLFLGRYFLSGPEMKKPQMLELNLNERMTGLENELKYLSSLYPSIEPSVFVWDYETGNYAGINSDRHYSAASIIKIPVLIQLFRSIEAGQLTIFDTMVLKDYYRAEGSGSLQFKAENSVWTIDDLARLMITESDNSATNMIMAKLGSMEDVNSGIRQWGLGHTRVNTWLPDMGGTNYTTAEDLARMLYNLDNPNFLSVSSREKIFDYMGHVHNDRLLPAGLGAGASILHKTGDIGKMLGDAGIVYAPNGKKYIVAIMANRPYNSVLGKDYIVKASSIIYNYLVK